MSSIRRNSGGFTLVELAIVLIVIGLLLGMAFKGKSLVDSARIKAEIMKVQKIQTAFSTFKAKYDRLPGQPFSTGTIESNKKIYEELIKEGLLHDSDFRSNLKESQGKHWFFAGCAPVATSEGTRSAWNTSAAFALENVCMFLASVHPKDIGPLTGATAYMETDAQMTCWIETMLDNSNILTGDGRKTVYDMEGWKTDGKFDNTLKAPCGDKKFYSGRLMYYAYRIY